MLQTMNLVYRHSLLPCVDSVVLHHTMDHTVMSLDTTNPLPNDNADPVITLKAIFQMGPVRTNFGAM